MKPDTSVRDSAHRPNRAWGGWLTALDASTGKTLWRAYSTGPDQDLRLT